VQRRGDGDNVIRLRVARLELNFISPAPPRRLLNKGKNTSVHTRISTTMVVRNSERKERAHCNVTSGEPGVARLELDFVSPAPPRRLLDKGKNTSVHTRIRTTMVVGNSERKEGHIILRA